ncbi:MAG: FN3 associated domain-containing protein, partial [Porcipelethomonas sp.]
MEYSKILRTNGYTIAIKLLQDVTVPFQLKLDNTQGSSSGVLGGYWGQSTDTSMGNLTIDLNGYTLKGNSTSSDNGNILNLKNTIVTIKNGTISGGNATGNGGAIYSDNTKLTLENVTLENNTAGGNGSGIYATGGTLTIDGGKITGNNKGYAVYVKDTSPAATVTKITGTEISNNTAGGLYVENKVEIRNATITANGSETLAQGGGIFYNRTNTTSTVDDTLTIDNCVITANQAKQGAGIYLASASDSVNDIAVKNCMFSGNTASDKGAAIFTQANKNGSQKGMMWLKLNNCIITNNTAPKGGGIYANAAADGVSEKYNKISLGGVTYIRQNKTAEDANSNIMLSAGGILTSEDTGYRMNGSASVGVASEEITDAGSPNMAALTNQDSTTWATENKYIVSDKTGYYAAFVPESNKLYLVKGQKEAAITEFKISGETNEAVIDKAANRVTIEVDGDLTNLTIESMKVTDGATFTPADHPTDFSSPVVYTVKNGNFVSQNWTVIVTKDTSVKYDVKVISGGGAPTSIGSYAQNKLVTVKAEEISGKVFKGWTSDDVTIQNPTDMETGFIMPAKEVTLTAVYDTIVPQVVVDLGVEKLMAGDILPTQATVTIGESTKQCDINWTPNTTVMAFTTYEASVTVPADEGYVYDSATAVAINGTHAKGSINADGSITITGKMASYVNLSEIKAPESIRVPYNTALESIALPETVTIGLEGAGDVAADVRWNIKTKGDGALDENSEEYDSNAQEYDPEKTGTQTFKGTVYLPDGVLQGEDTVLETTLNIIVGNQEETAVPMADVATGNYTKDLTIQLTAAENAKIYYTVDGTDPKTSETKTEYNSDTPIQLTGETGKTVSKTIKAYAAETNKTDSDTVTFTYTITKPCKVTVTDGKGSGEYLEGETVSITANEKEGKEFYRWSVTSGSVTLDNSTAKATSFVMLAESVEISAEYHDNIKSVELTVNAPQKGQALPSEATCNTTGISGVVLSWTPNSDLAASYTVYTATMKVQADTQNAYEFADSVTATVNGSAAVVRKNDDGSINVAYSFTTEKAVLQQINKPADISGIANGTTADQIKALLPYVVSLETDDGTKYAGVSWEIPDTYSSTEVGEQTFKATGTVILPEYVDNYNNISTTIELSVKVSEKDKVAAPMVDIPVGTYPVGFSVKLTSATYGAEIYYTVDGTNPAIEDGNPTGNTKLYNAEKPIEISGTAGKEVTVTIKAIAVDSNKVLTNSNIATYEYTVKIPACEEHEMTEHPAKAATCTEAGNYAYWTCSHEEGVYYKNAEGTATFENLEATVIVALDHEMTEHSAKAATCTATGNYAYWTC